MTVLVIDDDQINLDLFCLMLSMLDMATPVPLRHAQAALEWCTSNTPDLVVVDYLMPDIDGLAFLRRFRALPGMREVPVVMVTGATEVAIRHEALRLSANDFLTKPVNGIEFNVRIGNLLALQHARQQLAQRAETLDIAVRKATADIVAREHEAIHRLSRAAEFRDADTGFHLSRMAAYSRLIAVQLGLPEAECDLICDAAPMHDIGKVGIADAVLLKPGPLNDEERAIMQRHPQIGADILVGSESPLLQAGAVIAISHHERYDGGGYPHGLAGEAIPLYGRIIAVADVFDALTNARPYKPAWPLERAIDFLHAQKGTHFDPACVDALLANMDAVLAIQRRFQHDQA
ncbi:HD domain-containing phosphohydrolase [Duganella phyllosphaerae]|uniref:Cyclic di-GMP phosphodiesterase response regulator RpfG n=1 Tax=Duganella phyllosphaerae TaxID=762836 RepID=A0A1E7X6A0_9BURK|nr:HD domain-containing phosphohydrolase [Duganella phyllosphaerae]OFA08627.1 cyclic di-GMP phosphodiesterase response regulator RpfG [Duganella phyllosphaerae]